jgi:hypothetical protein
MDVRHPVELIQGGVGCLPAARRAQTRMRRGSWCPCTVPEHSAVAISSDSCFGSTVLARLHPGENNNRLFHDQIIFYGFDPFDAACDLTRFIDRLLRANEAAQLNGALVSLDTDLK